MVKALPREVQQEAGTALSLLLDAADLYLPEFVSRMTMPTLRKVLHGFDGSSTRDGNISRCFLGYVRSKWGQHYELDEETWMQLQQL